MRFDSAGSVDVASRLRRWLHAIVLLGTAGMATELLFIGHFEDAAQWIPVALLGAGAALLAWEAIAPGAIVLRLVQLTMLLFCASGVIGVVLHYLGNQEFELEMYPTMAGSELITNTLTGATPVLAPGSMLLLGLVGLVHTYRHPSLRTGDLV